ncbi:5-(carboxyamino)imidazole ribonucleotide synthase [Sphingomonas sp.]|uniref:5-(carboxyamino)imidazole ribonucleotide synthase n=1 Tax=Sphingomonas sp. TaxID=28214 RepID=UPI0025DA2467|nr:5-(carboxyamino)imidazole ribonucleotide synthase [Sphingomonas sp.]
MKILAPGSTIGIIGGGQLGRMLAIAAAQLGYRSHIYSPELSGPAADVAPRWTQGAYDDVVALAAFAAEIHVATYEFENVDADPLEALAARVPLHPPLAALRIAQDRVAEKTFAAAQGAVTAAWTEVNSRADLDRAIAAIGTPAILKTTRFGYDGKGQSRLASSADADAAYDAIDRSPAILEALVAFDHEYSVIVARGQDGLSGVWDAPENVHVDGILATSTIPPHPDIVAQLDEAKAIATRLADALDYVGVMAVEFFASAEGPVFNEMAPRVHNSGHWTIEGAVASQFENHIRAVCGLPLGDTSLVAPQVVMQNLIGADVVRWPELFAQTGAHVHLYGKHEAPPGRKMGHVTRISGNRVVETGASLP